MLVLTALLSVVMWRALLVAARHELALLASEERMKLAIDAGEAVTWDADLRSGKIIWSEGHFRLLGLAATASTEVTQAMFENAVLVEDLPIVQLEWQRAEAAHDVYRAEYRLRRTDGSIRWIRAAGRCLYDARGRAIRFVGVLFDVTEEKLAIETLRQADRRKNEFLATLAHEVRNPLAAVRSAVRLMQARRVQEQQWAVDLIDRQTQQMQRLIDDLFDVSRISHGTIDLKRERVELSSVVRAAVEASRPLLDRHGHELAVELPPHPIRLEADPARLTQVFCNLLNNSARYTPGAGQIVITAKPESHYVSVSVRDNGIGMRADMLPRVFEMFTQLDPSLKQSQSGLGIGLALVRRLVELHGGRVDARSEGIGKGSEFVVTLPLADDPAPVALNEGSPDAPLSFVRASDLRPIA